jgi:hypothetical protein
MVIKCNCGIENCKRQLEIKKVLGVIYVTPNFINSEIKINKKTVKKLIKMLQKEINSDIDFISNE